jgi:hypothetical protein
MHARPKSTLRAGAAIDIIERTAQRGGQVACASFAIFKRELFS